MKPVLKQSLKKKRLGGGDVARNLGEREARGNGFRRRYFAKP